MHTIEETKKVVEVGKLIAGVIVVSMVIGVTTAGFSELPERVDSLEAASGNMLTQIGGIEDRIDAVERSQADIKKEMQLISCLQLAEARSTAYQECLTK